MNEPLNTQMLRYSAAAAAGAFGLSSADAYVIHQSNIDGFIPTTLVSESELGIDMDNDGSIDVKLFVFNLFGNDNARGVIIDSDFSSLSGDFVSPSDTNNYYVFGFELDEEIDSSSYNSTELGVGDVSRGAANTIARWTGSYLLNVASEGYLGVEFDVDGNDHYGWISINIDQPTATTVSMEITGYAWESVAGVGILAGDVGNGLIPEPGHYALGLGLLAMGAAGIRARRRSK